MKVSESSIITVNNYDRYKLNKPNTSFVATHQQTSFCGVQLENKPSVSSLKKLAQKIIAFFAGIFFLGNSANNIATENTSITGEKIYYNNDGSVSKIEKTYNTEDIKNAIQTDTYCNGMIINTYIRDKSGLLLGETIYGRNGSKCVKRFGKDIFEQEVYGDGAILKEKRTTNRKTGEMSKIKYYNNGNIWSIYKELPDETFENTLYDQDGKFKERKLYTKQGILAEDYYDNKGRPVSYLYKRKAEKG